MRRLISLGMLLAVVGAIGCDKKITEVRAPASSVSLASGR